MLMYWRKVPVEVVESLSLEVFKKRIEVLLRHGLGDVVIGWWLN